MNRYLAVQIKEIKKLGWLEVSQGAYCQMQELND